MSFDSIVMEVRSRTGRVDIIMPGHQEKPSACQELSDRRSFLKKTAALFFISLLEPGHEVYARGKISTNAGHRLEGEFAFFTPYQAALAEEVSALIIPSDDSPGAREAGVVFELDRMAADSKKDQEVYTAGIAWLDYMAEKIADKGSFLDLSHAEKIRILTIADSGNLPFSEKLMFFIRYRCTRTTRRFFAMMRRRTMEIFYTSEAGWRMLGYKGPPQWAGYRDYYRCS